MVKTGETCKFSDMFAMVCRYDPPPAVRMIFGALQAEPATHINWQSLLDNEGNAPPLPVKQTCSEHRERSHHD